VRTTALIFPFDLFGAAGARTGAELLGEAIEEMLADNRREKVLTRAAAYMDYVQLRRLPLDTLEGYQHWRRRARQAIRRALRREEFVFWITGNHLGALPFYEELAASPSDTLVVQFDAHLDIYNLSDCTAELSHGNFLLHCEGELPSLINVGNREILLRPDYVARYYGATFSAAQLALDGRSALRAVGRAAKRARRVFLDLDCDVFDPICFPATANSVPFGLSTQQVLQLFDAAWCDSVRGVIISEFDPARDANDRCLQTLIWLFEYLLLKLYETR
jgi:arginase family enzyme